MLQALITGKEIITCRDEFLPFVRRMWPAFVAGSHHRKLAEVFERIARGELKRACISLPPRSTKSEFASYLFPAWYLGKFPNKQILQASHKAELAVGFGRKLRNLVATPAYAEVFGGLGLRDDSKAAGRWATQQGGSYYAAGVGAGLAGFGADLCVSGESIIQTDIGPMTAREVVNNKAGTRVLAYDHQLGRPVMANILARGSRLADRMVEITTTSTVLRCTHDHPVWVEGRGYVHAEDVRDGDSVLTTTAGMRGLRNKVEGVQTFCVDHGEEVFNITVEGHHNYFADGILTHNCIIDDPHDEQEAMHGAHDPEVFAKAYDWYQTGPRQRLQPGAAILVIHTRWSKQDLIGRLTQAMMEREGADQWEIIEIPAITDAGDSYWPEYWPIEELLATKNNIPPVRWNAQYMQAPSGEEGALVKREWWRRFDGGRIPDMEYVIQSWDTAHRKTQRSDFSVCTTWGVFRDEDGRPNIGLMHLWRARVEFPELKQKAIELYRRFNPDSCIIEGKAAGDALVQELRYMGLPISSYTPSRGEDKIVRVNAVTDLFASGIVWAPKTQEADELIEEFAEFPYGHHDDMVDASTLALLRYRQGNFIRLDSDEEEENFDPGIRADYY